MKEVSMRERGEADTEQGSLIKKETAFENIYRIT